MQGITAAFTNKALNRLKKPWQKAETTSNRYDKYEEQKRVGRTTHHRKAVCGSHCWYRSSG